MSTTKHTPGPWTIVSTVAHPFAVVADGKQVAVAQSAQATIQAPERAANARLIAAAPELLEANIKAIEVLTWAEAAGLPVQEHIQLREHLQQVRAAIAKATGTNA
jgi:hypothetical protein